MRRRVTQLCGRSREIRHACHAAFSGIPLLVALLGVSALAGSAAAVSCGEALTASVTLDTDLDCGGGIGLIIFGNDVVVDLAGHTISGTGAVGVDNTQGFERVTVKNGTIAGFQTGISLGGGTRHLIKGVEVRGGTYGIEVDSGVRLTKIQKSKVRNTAGTMISLAGDDHTVSQSVLVNGGGTGIVIFGARNVVTKTSVTGAINGIVVLNGSALVSGNTLTANASLGLVIAGPGPGNTVTKNRCEGNGEWGILLTGADDAVVSGNTSVGNAAGIRVFESARAVVTKNLVRGNRATGIDVDSISPGVVLNGNKVQRNRVDGIATAAPTTLVAKNTANENGRDGIAAPNGAQDGGANKARDNGSANCSGPTLACK